jgi:hypothetical protein
MRNLQSRQRLLRGLAEESFRAGYPDEGERRVGDANWAGTQALFLEDMLPVQDDPELDQPEPHGRV